MQFVQPLFLIAFVALAIPVIIHLFNFRKYKKVYFTNVRFLQQIQQVTKKQSQLKQRLVLLARMLAIIALVLAFSQPYLPFSPVRENRSDKRFVGIYIDNSYSMEAVETQGKLIDLAKTRALEIASAYHATDLFQLQTNDFEGRHQRPVNRDEFGKLVDEVRLSPATRTLPEIISRQNDLLQEYRSMNRDAYLISDFQKSTMSLQNTTPDSSAHWFLLPLQADKRNNLYIDSAWFLSPVHQPGQPVQLKVRVRNDGSEPLEKIPVKLTINNVQKAIGSFVAGPHSATEIILPYTENPAGIQFGKIEIADYPIVYDDHYYFSYALLPSIPVLCIHEKNDNKYLNALFGSDSAFTFTNSLAQQFDHSTIPANALIILDGIPEPSSGLAQSLLRFTKNGGTLVVFPPEKGNPEGYRPFFDELNTFGYAQTDTTQQRVSYINLEQEVFSNIFLKNAAGKTILPENVDLPVVFKHYVIPSGTKSDLEVLMRLQNNDPFLVAARLEKGNIYFFTVPLSDTWSNFAHHLIFLPTLYNIALLSNRLQPLSFPVGENSVIEIPLDPESEKTRIKITNNETNFEMAPEVKKSGYRTTLYTQGQIGQDGPYSVKNGKKTIAGLAFNYNRKESEMNCFSDNELQNFIKKIAVSEMRILQPKKISVSQQIEQIRQGTPLWKLFVILALLFLAAEIALLRFLK